MYKHCTMQLPVHAFDTAFGGGHSAPNFWMGANVVITLFLCMLGPWRQGALCPRHTKITLWQGLSVDVDTTLKKARNLRIESTSKWDVDSTSVFRRWFNFQTKPKIDQKSTSGCDVDTTSEKRWICVLNRRRNETWIQRQYFDVDSTFKL